MKNFLRLSIGLIVLIVPLLLVSNNSNAQENISDESALIVDEAIQDVYKRQGI